MTDNERYTGSLQRAIEDDVGGRDGLKNSRGRDVQPGYPPRTTNTASAYTARSHDGASQEEF